MLIHCEYVDSMVPSVRLFMLPERQSLALKCSYERGGSLELLFFFFFFYCNEFKLFALYCVEFVLFVLFISPV